MGWVWVVAIGLLFATATSAISLEDCEKAHWLPDDVVDCTKDNRFEVLRFEREDVKDFLKAVHLEREGSLPPRHWKITFADAGYLHALTGCTLSSDTASWSTSSFEKQCMSNWVESLDHPPHFRSVVDIDIPSVGGQLGQLEKSLIWVSLTSYDHAAHYLPSILQSGPQVTSQLFMDHPSVLTAYLQDTAPELRGDVGTTLQTFVSDTASFFPDSQDAETSRGPMTLTLAVCLQEMSRSWFGDFLPKRESWPSAFQSWHTRVDLALEQVPHRWWVWSKNAEFTESRTFSERFRRSLPARREIYGDLLSNGVLDSMQKLFADGAPMKKSITSFVKKCEQVGENFAASLKLNRPDYVATPLFNGTFLAQGSDVTFQPSDGLRQCRRGKFKEIKKAIAGVRRSNIAYLHDRILTASVIYMPHIFERELRGIRVLESVKAVVGSLMALFQSPDYFVEILLNNAHWCSDNPSECGGVWEEKGRWGLGAFNKLMRRGNSRQQSKHGGRTPFDSSDKACVTYLSTLSKTVFASLEYVDLEVRSRQALQAKSQSHVMNYAADTVLAFIGIATSDSGSNKATELYSQYGGIAGKLIGMVKGITYEAKKQELQTKLDTMFSELKGILIDMDVVFSSVLATYETYRTIGPADDLCFVLRLYCEKRIDPKCRPSLQAIEASLEAGHFTLPDESKSFTQYCSDQPFPAYKMNFSAEEKWKHIFLGFVSAFTNLEAERENVLGEIVTSTKW